MQQDIDFEISYVPDFVICWIFLLIKIIISITERTGTSFYRVQAEHFAIQCRMVARCFSFFAVISLRFFSSFSSTMAYNFTRNQ